ncbi:MAG: nucleotide exchange factor GrpE [Patescibacteria group bacterium]
MDRSDTKIKISEKKGEVEKQDENHEEEKKVNKEIEELKKRLEELDNKYKRALADYQNLEKRVREEKREWLLTVNKDLLLHLLPVLDTLILAKKHIKVHDEGLSLSIKQFEDLLKAEGVERIETVGKSFDPHLMQCVETIEGEEGKIVEEIRAGYKLHNTVLRAALVKVGKKKIEKEEIVN